DGLHAELPMITRLLMDVVRICQTWVFMLTAPMAVVGACFGIRWFIHTDAGKYVWDAYKIKMPIFGEIFYKVAVVRLCRALGTLLASGMGTITAMTMSGAASGNERMRRFMFDACEEVKEGRKMSDAFKEGDMFEFIVPSMVGVGEQTG